MIIEDIAIEKLPRANEMFSIKENFSSNSFMKCIQIACPYFVKIYKGKTNKLKLNEDMISQLLAMEIQKVISQFSFPFFVQIQFVDDKTLSKGKPDLFFFENSELGVESKYLFFVEAKRLPSKTYKTEYVIGEKKNGGIERFKLGIHGKGKRNNGIIGYIQNENSAFWIKEINSWITNLSKTTPNWKSSEKLKRVGINNTNSIYCSSIVLRKSSIMQLHHLLIELN